MTEVTNHDRLSDTNIPQ